MTRARKPSKLVVGWIAALVATNAHAIELKTFGTHTRLVFPVDSGVNPTVKKDSKGFEITFPGLVAADIGEHAKTLSDSRFRGIEVVETDTAVVVKGQWRFASGTEAPAQPVMETFDFRRSEPPAYVFDFWTKAGPTVAEARLAAKRAEKEALTKRIATESESRKKAKAESEFAKLAQEDLTPFCKKPLDPNEDVILPFRPVHEEFDLGRWFSTTMPDVNYVYLEPTGDSKDAEYTRLALKLYRQGKTALAIRTIQFLDSEVPESIYRHEMHFLKANALLKLSKENEAIEILRNLITATGKSPVAINSAIYLAKRSMDRQEYLQALETFLWLTHHYPTHKQAWLFRYGAAECLFSLRQAERATEEYRAVIAQSGDPRVRVVASARIGDLSFSRRNYEQALASYYQTYSRFGDEAKTIPSLHINRAETLYQLGQLDRAEAEFKSFLNQFSSHPLAWRAMFRLGEIGARSPVAGLQAEGRKFFENTINTYPLSPGTVLSRLRLLPCEDHAGMSYSTAIRFFETDAADFKDDKEVFLDRYSEFRGLSRVKTLISMNRLDEAVQAGIQEYGAHPKSSVKPIIANLLRASFRKKVNELLDAGQGYDALAYFQKYRESVPRPRPGSDDFNVGDHLLRLAQVTSSLGLGDTAQEIAALYRSNHRNLTASERKLANESFEGALEKSRQAYTAAKALWVDGGMTQVEKVLELLEGVIEESEHSYEREVLRGVIAEKQGKFASALKHALKAQLLAPKESGREVARVAYWVASLQARAGDPRLASQTFGKIAAIEKIEAGGLRSDGTRAIGLPEVPTREQLLMTQGEILGNKLSRWGDAAKAYDQAIALGGGGNQALYELSRALNKSAKQSDRARARDTLEKLAESETDDFWRKLARQNLADENGKYKPRKPAKEGGV